MRDIEQCDEVEALWFKYLKLINNNLVSEKSKNCINIFDHKKIAPKKNMKQLLKWKELLTVLAKLQSGKITKSEHYDIEEKLAGQTNLLAMITRSLNFAMAKNISAADKIILEILSEENFYYSFKSDIYMVKDENVKKYLDEILILLGNSYTSRELKWALMDYLSTYNYFSPVKNISSMSDAKEKFNTGSFWPRKLSFFLVYRQVTSQGKKTVEAMPIARELRKRIIFYPYMQKNLKTELLPEIQKMNFGQSDYEQSILYRLKRNKEFREIYSAQNSLGPKLQVKFERNFYRYLLFNDLSPVYAIFKLIQLGDINEEYLPMLDFVFNERI